MKPALLNTSAVPDMELLKEAVCDSLINLTFARVSGFGDTGAIVFGRKPSRHFVSGALLPGFDPSGLEDETSDIRINTHGLDLGIAADQGTGITVAATIAVYVRGLPEWKEVTNSRYAFFPVFQPNIEIRRALKTAVKDRIAAWRDGPGKGASYQDYLAAKKTAYEEECRKFGLPGPDTNLENIARQTSDDVAAEEESSEESEMPPEDALYDAPVTGLPDHLAEQMRPPEVWVRIPVTLGPWEVDLKKSLQSAGEALSHEIELTVRDALEAFLKSEDGRLRAYRDVKIVPSDCQSRVHWDAYLSRARMCPARASDLLPTPFNLRLTLAGSPDRRRLDTKLMRVALEHHGSRPANAQQPFFEPACFQASLTVKLSTATLRPMPLDRVKPSYRYRQYMRQDAIGVNCGIASREDGDYTVLSTRWAPRYVLPRQVPRSGSTAPRDYKRLSDPGFDVAGLRCLPDEYNAWVDAVATRIDPRNGADSQEDADAEQKRFEEDLIAYKAESADIARGIELLVRSQTVFRADPASLAAAPYRAWLMMNEAFGEAGKDINGRSKFLEWRLFQMAFILAQIPGFASRLPDYADDFCPDRDEETASLLYFATGGGKSEAFFGTLIFLLFLDRLRGKVFGVSVLVRYPLRLLTVQQARRLFRILVHADLIRRAHSVSGAPFQLGFWVGSSNTPNTLNDERVKAVPFNDVPALLRGSAAESKYKSIRRALNKVPTCPFCEENTELRRWRSEGAGDKYRLALLCLNKTCHWNKKTAGDTLEPLPFLLVDEDIYARAPSVVLGTIDKLALIGQNDNTISKVFGMFGQARWKLDGLDRVAAPRDAKQNTPPPGHTALKPLYADGETLFVDPLPALVIQDEAHLLEESLGAFAGLFETTLEQVFRQNSELYGDLVARHPLNGDQPGAVRMPKIIAATATVSDPARQTEILYQRHCKQFPWPGPDLYESFYSLPKSSDAQVREQRLSDTGAIETFAPWSRVYVSFMTNGGTHTITTVNILAALHATMTGLLTDLWNDASLDAQKGALIRLMSGLTSPFDDPASDLRRIALESAGAAGHYDVLASLVDLHRVVLTYVTNKKGGDVVLDALQDVSRDVHRYDGLPDLELKQDLISGGVDMEGIERVMREAEADRTAEGEFLPLADSLRNIVATSAISHGVDVDRFNSMVFAGIPSSIAEYIQASSRVGRTHVGFSLLVPTPQSRRDRYVVEVHAPFHRFLERMISPPAIDRWAANAIKRVMPSLFQAWLIGYVEPRLFAAAADKKKARQLWSVDNIRRLLEPIKNREKLLPSFIDFALGAVGVTGRGQRLIGAAEHKDFYIALVTAEAREIYMLFVGHSAELGVTNLSKFWEGSTEVRKPMMSLRDVEEGGLILPARAPVGRKGTDGYQDDVEAALRFLRRQRSSGSELDTETGI